jgi:hypothetical protein
MVLFRLGVQASVREMLAAKTEPIRDLNQKQNDTGDQSQRRRRSVRHADGHWIWTLSVMGRMPEFLPHDQAFSTIRTGIETPRSAPVARWIGGAEFARATDYGKRRQAC